MPADMSVKTDVGRSGPTESTTGGAARWFHQIERGSHAHRECDCRASECHWVQSKRVGSSPPARRLLFRTLRYMLAGMTLAGAAFVTYNTYERTRMNEMFSILKKNNAWALQHVNSGFVMGFLTGSIVLVVLAAYVYEVVHDAWSDEHWSVDFYNDQAHSLDYRIYRLQYDFHDTVWIDVFSALVGGLASMLVAPADPFLQRSVIRTHGVLTALVRCALALPLLLPYRYVRYSPVWVLLYPLVFVLSSGIHGLFRYSSYVDASSTQWPLYVCMVVPFLIFKYVLQPDNWADNTDNMVNFNDLRPFALYAYGLIVACAFASRALQHVGGACRGRDRRCADSDGGRREYVACTPVQHP
jgi:hypothetical protein